MKLIHPKANLGQPRSRGGFTLVELLLVLTILAILAGIVLPKLSGRTEQAKIAAVKSQIATFGTALDAYEVDNGNYPKGRNGLDALMRKPRDADSWHGPYMQKEIPLDPWQHPYIYECPGKRNQSGYDLYSKGGADGHVYGNWTETTQ